MAYLVLSLYSLSFLVSSIRDLKSRKGWSLPFLLSALAGLLLLSGTLPKTTLIFLTVSTLVLAYTLYSVLRVDGVALASLLPLYLIASPENPSSFLPLIVLGLALSSIVAYWLSRRLQEVPGLPLIAIFLFLPIACLCL